MTESDKKILIEMARHFRKQGLMDSVFYDDEPEQNMCPEKAVSRVIEEVERLERQKVALQEEIAKHENMLSALGVLPLETWETTS